MDDPVDALAVSLFSEILTVDQLARHQLSRVLPKGMEISHFSVLNHLARTKSEKTPAQLAQLFHVTRGAMTNTIAKLEWAGYVHVRPDWDDARRKWISISPAGRNARDLAYQAISPTLRGLVEDMGADAVRHAIPILRALRARMEEEG
ncbi:MarR family winged helix-turn-helix transcriptional regulator [Pseudaestuariivita sp.]|uniref:MarR family winged helix-turn-helix transcriptional regulator n=1 Tax=Pseudaestuariivita sp. TaxID=2211669 RepID=UPI0040599C2B